MKKVNWKDTITVATITNDIANVSSEYTTFIDTINTYRKAMLADYTLPSTKGKSKVRPRTIKKLHNYSYSALSEGLLSDYDIVDVSPRGNKDNDSALANKLLLNYQLNEEMELQPVVEKCAKYFEDFGSYYLKLEWNYKERKEINTNPKELVSLPNNIAPEQIQQLEANNMLSPEGLLIKDREITKVVSDHPVISIKKHNQLILGTSSDGSNNLQSLSFIADRSYVTLSDLEISGKYENLDMITNKGISSDVDISSLPDADFETTFNEMLEDDNSDFCDKEKVNKHTPLVSTEYWTKVLDGNRLITTVTTVVGGVIIRKEESPFGSDVGYPFARGVNEFDTLTTDSTLYEGVPDTLEIEQEQKVIGAVTRSLIDILGSTASGQKGIAEGFLNPLEERNLELGKNYKFNPALDPNRAMVTTKMPELPNSGLQMLSIMENSVESSTGKKLFGQGLSSESYGQVAAGVRAVTDATTQRQIASVRRFNKGFIDIISMLAEVNKEFITDDKIIALSDGTFSTIRNDQLQSSISIKISASTPELDDKKANDLMFVVQTLGDSVSFRMKQLLLADVARMKKRPDLAKALLEEPEPQPSPQELELHQLNVELLKAKIANEYAKAEDSMANSDLKEAKANTEEAKAGVLSSTKDNQDLDFIQKRNGTKEQRRREDKDKDHMNTMETHAFRSALNTHEGVVQNDISNKPSNGNKPSKENKKRDNIPVIDFPQESLQPSDIIK